MKIHKTVFVHKKAHITGDVEIGENSSVWPFAVLRGDMNRMRIGRYTNIQDNVVVHVDSLFEVKIGDYVTLGHSCIVHGAKIGDNVLVGINSTILNGAEIGSNSIIGANALVPEGMKVPEKSLVLGVPAKVKELKKDVGLIKTYALTYFVLSRGYLRGERVFPPKEFLREVESYIKSI